VRKSTLPNEIADFQKKNAEIAEDKKSKIAEPS
jgi:hypothetical protein